MAKIFLALVTSGDYLYEVMELFNSGKLAIDSEIGSGCTPLTYSASYGRSSIVEYLLEERKIDVNQVDDDGESALMKASQGGHLHLVQYLVSRGARVDLADYCGDGALHHAAVCDRVDVVRFLIGVGADIEKVKRSKIKNHVVRGMLFNGPRAMNGSYTGTAVAGACCPEEMMEDLKKEKTRLQEENNKLKQIINEKDIYEDHETYRKEYDDLEFEMNMIFAAQEFEIDYWKERFQDQENSWRLRFLVQVALLERKEGEWEKRFQAQEEKLASKDLELQELRGAVNEKHHNPNDAKGLPIDLLEQMNLNDVNKIYHSEKGVFEKMKEKADCERAILKAVIKKNKIETDEKKKFIDAKTEEIVTLKKERNELVSTLGEGSKGIEICKDTLKRKKRDNKKLVADEKKRLDALELIMSQKKAEVMFGDSRKNNELVGNTEAVTEYQVSLESKETGKIIRHEKIWSKSRSYCREKIESDN